MRRGDARASVEHQARARDICVEAGLPRETTLMQLVLGAYLVAANDMRLAAKTYGDASTYGEQNGLKDLAAQAELALGALHLRERHHEEAYVAYLRAANLAKDAGMNLIAIEALRLAGQIRAEAGNEEKAMELWAKAIEIAENVPPAEARASSAAEAARGIAMIGRKRGLGEQARRFEEKSRELSGEVASGERTNDGTMQSDSGV